MNKNITPIIVKAKYLKCLDANYLNFYPSRKNFIKVSASSAVSRRPFEVRFCPALVAKKVEVSAVHHPSSPRNPFLPFDQNLFVSDLNSSADHVVIFNKFCVIEEHLLIITKEFVEQSAEFRHQDFRAVNEVLGGLQETKPLAFYNSGAEAGASQAHRHFQVIPTSGNIPPIEEHVEAVDRFDEPFSIPLYSSFQHACIRRLSPAAAAGAEEEDPSTWHFEAYKKLKASSVFPNSAFNLLWTRDWMLLVPRRKEFTDDNLNSLNAMAFAGYFLVTDEAHSRELNVIECLQQVTFATQ